MKKFFVVIGIICLFNTALLAVVDTRLQLENNNYNFATGIGTLRLRVEARAVGTDEYIKRFRGSILLDYNIVFQKTSVTFGYWLFDNIDYTQAEDYPDWPPFPGNYPKRTISYDYELRDGGTAVMIPDGGTWRRVVVIVITYDLNEFSTRINWPTPSDFLVMNTSDVNVTGTRVPMGAEFRDIQLPVQLGGFEVLPAPNKVGNLLSWKTESEIDNIGFNIWRSETEADIYDEEGQVINYRRITADLIPGAGTSTSPQEYSYLDRTAENDRMYYYKIEQIDVNGQAAFFGPVALDRTEAVPIDYVLSQNFPNPFNPSTTIKYYLSEDSQVSLSVFNLLGKRVRVLAEGQHHAGLYSVSWDGRDDNGQVMGSGIYFYELDTGVNVYTRKMTILR
jgi:hypothetical protein